MIAPALPADPLDRVDLVVDQHAEPADVDRLLDALDRIVERRLSQRNENETGGLATAARFSDSIPHDLPGQEEAQCLL